ncbi:hypothetical protein JI667_00370 [Bacillus sp. NTK074B]|uniref:hypothetical protein n=1 Tax=Bacillus sp. NTK074B TaxID=2802174 RepID=UPI001A8D3395|nr:hypothetical protein [Bacillus sp. NTK074B]
MKDQVFMDINISKEESLAELLQGIVLRKREEAGTHSVYVQEVIPTYPGSFTIILEIDRSIY